MDKIQIFHFVPGFKFGGIESRIMDLYDYIDKDIYQYNFVTFSAETNSAFEKIISDGGKVITVPPVSARTIFKHIKAVKMIYKNNHVDVAHCYSPQSGLAFLFFAKINNVNCRILHARTSSFGADKHPFIKTIVKKLEVRLANVRLAVSKKSGDWLFGNRQYYIIPNAINLEKFRFSEETRISIREKYGLTDAFVIGHVGRSTYAKNHAYLFRVFVEVKKKYENAKLLLVGPEKNDKNLLVLCEKYDILDNIVFVGYQQNTAPFYCAMDYFVFPSFYEGLPGTIIEAQASGVKCLVSDRITEEVGLTDDVQYMNIDDDPASWADRIYIDNYSHENDNISKIKAKGYSLEVAAQKIMNIYQKSKMVNDKIH